MERSWKKEKEKKGNFRIIYFNVRNIYFKINYKGKKKAKPVYVAFQINFHKFVIRA